MKRIAIRIGQGLTLLMTFVVALVGGVIVHLDLPAVRRVVEAQVNSSLDAIGDNHIELHGLQRLGGTGVRVRSAKAHIAGIATFTADEVDVRFSAFDLLRRFVASHALDVRIARVTVSYLDTALELDRPTPPKKEEEPSSPSTLRLSFDDVQLAHGWVHGGVSPTFASDAEADALAARFEMTPEGMSGKLQGKLLVRSGVNEPVSLEIAEARVSLPAPVDVASIDAFASIRAASSGVNVVLDGSLRAGDVHASLTLDDPRGGGIHRLVDAVPLTAPIKVDVQTEGHYPDLRVSLHSAAEPSDVSLTASVHAQAPMSVEGDMAAHDVDLARLGVASLVSRLGTELHLTAHQAGDDWNARAHGRVLRGEIAGHLIPEIALDATWAGGSGKLAAHADERGAPLDVTASYEHNGDMSASVHGNVVELARVDRLRGTGSKLAGRARVDANVAVRRGSLSGDATVRASGLSFPPVSAARLDVRAHAAGTLASPIVHASVTGDDIHASSVVVSHLQTTLRGTPAALEVEVGTQGGLVDELKASAGVQLSPSLSVHDLQLKARKGMREAHLTVERVQLGGGEMRAQSIEVTGLGEPIRADIRKSSTRLDARLDARKIDLRRVAEMLPVTNSGLSGTIAVAATVQQSPSDLDAHADIVLDQIEPPRMSQPGTPQKRAVASSDPDAPEESPPANSPPASEPPETVQDGGKALTFNGRVKVDVHDRQGDLLVHAGSAELGYLHAQGDATVSDPSWNAKAIAAARGKLHFQTNAVAVGRICALVGCGSAVGGWNAFVEAEGDVARGEPSAEGDTQVSLAAKVTDDHGILLDLSSKTRFDALQIMRGGKPNLQTPVDLHLALSPRSFEQFPALVRPTGVVGSLAARVDVGGTVALPQLFVQVNGTSLRPASAPRTTPIDLELVSTYDTKVLGADVRTVLQGKDVLHVSATVNALLADVLAKKAQAPWNGSVRVTANKFPLSAVPVLGRRRVRGDISGEVAVAGIHQDPRIAAEVTVGPIVTRDLPFGNVRLSAKADAHHVGAEVDWQGQRGNGSVNVDAPLVWTDALVPGLGHDAPLHGHAQLTKLDLAPLEPFLGDSVARLGGQLDAAVDVELPAHASWSAVRTRGDVRLQKGQLFMTQIGRELHELAVHVTADPEGSVVLQELKGMLGNGSFHGTGRADMAGNEFHGGHLEFHVPTSEPVPIGFGGVSYGKGFGDIVADAALQGPNIQLDVQVDQWRMELPTESVPHLESLDPNPHVVVLQPLAPPSKKAKEPKPKLAPPTEQNNQPDNSAVREDGAPRSARRRLTFAEASAQATPAAMTTAGAEGDGPAASPIASRNDSAPVNSKNEPARAVASTTYSPDDPQGDDDSGDTAPPAHPIVIRVKLGNNVGIRRGDMRVELSGEPVVTIAEKVELDGFVRVLGGRIEAVGKVFMIDRGVVRFGGADPANPSLDIDATYEGGESPISVHVGGTVKKPTLKLTSSDPSRSTDQLLGELAGVPNGSNASQDPGGGKSPAAGIAAGVLSSGVNHLLGGSIVPVQAKLSNTEASATVELSDRVRIEYIRELGQRTPAQPPDFNLIALDWRFRPNWLLRMLVGDGRTTSVDVTWQKWY